MKIFCLYTIKPVSKKGKEKKKGGKRGLPRPILTFCGCPGVQSGKAEPYQEKLITVIKKNESKYKKALRNKIKQEKRVTLKIDKKIREEIARANRIAKEKEKNKLKRVKMNGAWRDILFMERRSKVVGI